MTMYFLGVDIGSSKSHAVIADDTGHVLSFAGGGGGNHETEGVEGFRHVLHTLVADALYGAGLQPHQIAGAGFGIAGYDWDEDTPLVEGVIGALDLDAPYEAMNDAGLGLLAGAKQGWGVSIAAGTGVNARGRSADGRMARVTGNGVSFGEVGGSYELVWRARHDIARAWSKLGPKTSLSARLVAYVRARDVEDLLAGLVRERYKIGPEAAPLVFEEARLGDAVALDAVRWLAHGLGELACGIARQLDIAEQSFDVVLSGSMFKSTDLLLPTMQEVVHAFAPHAQFIHLAAPPVTGAVLLGMQKAGVRFLPLRDRVVLETRMLVEHYAR